MCAQQTDHSGYIFLIHISQRAKAVSEHSFHDTLSCEIVMHSTYTHRISKLMTTPPMDIKLPLYTPHEDFDYVHVFVANRLLKNIRQHLNHTSDFD